MILSFTKDDMECPDSGIHPDSGDAKNYYSILERILGSEISGALAQKDLQEEPKLLLKSKDIEV